MTKKLVKTLCEVPDDLFNNAKHEITCIDWQSVTDHRSNAAVFKTSTAIHLRMHNPPPDKPFPRTINEWSEILDCADHPKHIKMYPATLKLAEWIYSYVGGIRMGKIIIINLAPRGEVGLHIDPMRYFELHSRFHVPIITNPGVLFSGGPGTDEEYMCEKYLHRLNNRLPHMLVNNSDLHRIHVLVDVETPEGNVIF